MDPNDPFADLVPGGVSSGRVGYIPGVPKAKDPLDVESKQLDIENKKLDIAKKQQTPSGEAPKQLPATAAAGIQANLESLRAVQAARAALDGRPESIGPGTGMLGDTFTQFNDPAGTDTRSRVGKIGAVTIHDLSGAAVSATEAPRFQPFVPTPQDRPEVAKEKLKNFEEALRAQIKESLDYYSPANGYMPYKTPQAQQFQSELEGASNSPKMPKRFTPEQQDQFFAILDNSGVDAADEYTRKTIGASIKDKAAAAKPHSSAIDYSIADAQAKQRIADDAAKRGNAGSDALGNGLAQGITLGAADEIQSFGDAARESLSGKGKFSDIYNASEEANQAYQNYLRDTHAGFYAGGELAGGLIPGMAAPGSSLAEMMGSGAAIGGITGFNSGHGIENRLGNAILGAGAGAAAGYAIPKGFQIVGGALRRSPGGAVPELVDSATGALNQPLEAMRPGERVAAADQFGIDLPLDAAGGRTAAVIGKGLDIMPGSAGVMEDARRATEQQVANAADNVASGFGASRTLSEGGSELQRGAAERIERGKGVISKAYNAIPIADAAPASNSNAVAALKELTGRFASNPELADAVRDPRLVTYLNAIDKGGLSWRDLKDFRSLVGEKIGDMRFGEGHSTQDLRALYGALSEDMRNTAAAKGGRALRAFERANNLNRENQNLIEGALTRILGKDGKLAPEKAAAAVQAMVKGGKSTGDLKTLAQIRSATVKSGAWDEIASTLIRLGGQPANSAGRDFNPQTFTNWYADMAQPARNLLFGQGELRKSLDQFVAVNQRLTKVNALRNTSNTAGSMMAGGTVAALGATIMNPMLGAKVLAVGAGNFGMAKVWTNPAFVRWATGMSRAASAPAAKSQIGRLSKLAATNPELREPIISLQRQLLSAINDNVATPLAASDGGSENQN